MAVSADNFEALTKAFSGIGVDERVFVSVLGESEPEARKSFRKRSSHFSNDDERLFERWNDTHVQLLKHEFKRFKHAVIMWAMHPWERDARLAHKALSKGPQYYDLLFEIASTRSSDELLGARKAYHSIFARSLEEDVANNIDGPERKVLVALVSAYRYEGTNVNEEGAQSDASALAEALKNSDNPLHNDEVVRILGTRSKLHLTLVYNYYKDISGNQLDEDLGDPRLVQTVQCLCDPLTYFCKVIHSALEAEADNRTRKALTRVIVSRADVDMKMINREYENTYGVSLSEKIEGTANGNYKDLMLALVARGC